MTQQDVFKFSCYGAYVLESRRSGGRGRVDCVHYGEEKHHVKLSKDTSDYGRTNEKSGTTLSASGDDHIAANASTHGSSTLGPSSVSAKTASLDQADAPQQVYTQSTTIKDENRASSWSHYPSFGGEKDNTAAGVNVPASPLPYPPSEGTLRDRSLSKDEHEAKAPDEDEIASSPYPEGGLRAWLVVFGSFSGMTASFGVLNMAGTFQAYLSTHQLVNESPSNIGWIFSLYAFLTFFCGVQIGPVFDAKGPRWLVAAGSVLLFAGMMGTAESTKLWHFILTYSILCGLASSLIFTPAVGAVAHFFSKRRGVATGLAATGGSIGGIVFPLMLQRLFPTLGFKWAVRILAFVSLFLLLLANLLIRSNPRIRPPTNSTLTKDIWPDFRIYKHKVFALTTAGVFFIEWALFIPLSYISSYAIAHGVNEAFSYQLLSILNAGSFFGRWLPGYIADRCGRFNAMIATCTLCLISVLGLWLTATPSSGGPAFIAQLCIFAVLFGIASGSNISLTPVCVGQLCKTEVFGRWYASLYTVVSFGCLTGIPIAGEILARGHGSYRGLILFVGVNYVLGVVCFVWARVEVVGWGVRKIY